MALQSVIYPRGSLAPRGDTMIHRPCRPSPFLFVLFALFVAGCPPSAAPDGGGAEENDAGGEISPDGGPRGNDAGPSPCPGENPAGCIADPAGCPAGYFCGITEECVPSSCACNATTGEWLCTEDCGGGVCEDECDAPGAEAPDVDPEHPGAEAPERDPERSGARGHA